MTIDERALALAVSVTGSSRGCGPVVGMRTPGHWNELLVGTRRSSWSEALSAMLGIAKRSYADQTHGNQLKAREPFILPLHDRDLLWASGH